MSDEPRKPYRIWSVLCPFRKTGFPVVGTFGATSKPVIILTVETWQRMCVEIPELATTSFEVGTLE